MASTVPDVRQGLDWIPDHQLHVLETLGHANELIAEVLTCLDGYFAEGDGPFEVRDEYSGPLCNATITARDCCRFGWHQVSGDHAASAAV